MKSKIMALLTGTYLSACAVAADDTSPAATQGESSDEDKPSGGAVYGDSAGPGTAGCGVGSVAPLPVPDSSEDHEVIVLPAECAVLDIYMGYPDPTQVVSGSHLDGDLPRAIPSMADMPTR